MPEVQGVLYFLMLGLFVGYFYGLLGIGGGLIMVPALVFLFEMQQLPAQHVFHLALGTSMATILFTSLFSTYQHQLHRAISWDAFRYITPGILLGTLLGTLIVGLVSTFWLTLFFAVFVYVAAAQMWLGLKPSATRDYPTRKEVTLAGMLIGCVSSLVSIGGGVLSVPYLLWHRLPLHHAIATSAALGFPIALGGTLGHIANGMLSGKDLPQYALGYVYLPVLFWVVVGTMLTTHLGALSTHRLPVGVLKRIFAVMLFLLATRMLFKLFA